jgi:hypothetical protein
VIGHEGTGSLDIRATFQTDDGAIVYAHYAGRLDASRGLQLPAVTIYVASRFETSDERYVWLNRVQGHRQGHGQRGSVARLRVV